MSLYNAIGPFVFLDLAGGVELPKLEVESEQRPGVDNTQFRTLGKKGRPFTLVSKCDAVDVNDAQLAFALYSEMVGTLQPLAQYNRDYTAFNVEFMVLNVSPIKISALLFMVGGLWPPSQGWIEAAWVLQAVTLSA